MTPPRILLAGLCHETNTFADDLTGLKNFTILRGVQVVETRDDGSPMGAFVGFAEEKGWTLLPTAYYRAMPSGMVRDEVIEQFWDDFRLAATVALAGGVEAIFLILHGAMVSASLEDVEGTLLERIRALPGAENIPIFGVTDLHGNFTEKMATHANLLVTFRENPHTDAAQTAVRAAELLARTLETGRIPRTRFRQFPVVWPPTGTATAERPMRDLEEIARRLETEGHWSANIYGGFALADVRDTGVSVAVSGDGPEAEFETALEELEQSVRAHALSGFPQEWDLEDVLDDIVSKDLDGPILLVEPADNVGGGAPGDGTTILRALVTRNLRDCGVIINDPVAVQKLSGIKAGEFLTLPIGGRGSRLDPGPIELRVQLLSRSDGVFQLEDKFSHLAALSGTRVEMGDSAVVQCQGVTILLTTLKTPPMDLAQWTSQGVDPRKFRIIGVKAAVAHRQAYDKIATASYTVKTPGPCSSDIAALPFHRIRRPIAPLDPFPTH